MWWRKRLNNKFEVLSAEVPNDRDREEHVGELIRLAESFIGDQSEWHRFNDLAPPQEALRRS